MRLVVSEKNIAARRIAEILAVGKPKAEKVYTTPVYTFRRDGEDWVSIGLKGHIMEVDFPETFEDTELKKWNLGSLSTLVRAPVLKLPKERGIIQSLKSLAKKAEEVIIATDYDREGELIGSDARDIVVSVNPDVPVFRVRFSAITKGEIERAFAEQDVISEELAQAGETRQDIDLIWGAVVTRYLTLAHQTKTRRPFGDVLSAGRVQTPTLKLIIDREKEREAFDPEDYWVVKGAFEKDGDRIPASHATERFKSEEAAHAVIAALEGASEGTVTGVKRTKRTVKPPVPFNTTSLMAAAASEGFAPAKTMRLAESLYMSGYVSYPRVDNTVYPPSLDLVAILKTLDAVPAYHEHVQVILRKGALTPTRGPKETTDHPPIHPTGALDPESVDAQVYKLYNLIARRFMATLSDAAVIEGTRADFDVTGQPFYARGDVVVKAGFRAVYHYGLKKDEVLPPLAEGERVAFLGAEMEAKQTQPSARYSQGKLIQEMEKLGLGTKATRHDIIQGLYDRRYVHDDPIEPTCKGRTVIEALTTYADRITSPDMTSELEAEMDAIANARASRETVVGHSRELLAGVMDKLVPIAEEVGELLKSATDEDAKVGVCPKSGHDLLIKFSPKTRSSFVGCSGYPECDVTYPLPKNAKYAALAELCPVCGTPQVKVLQFKKKPRVMCLSPICPTKKGPEILIRAAGCPTGDGGDLRVAYSAVGNRYVRCTNYENCKTSYPLPQSGDIETTDDTCECGAPIVIVHTKKGPWRICIDPACPLKSAATKGAKKGKGKPAAKAGTKKKTSTKRTGGKKA
ncbi:MAG: DNA topoisomerase I [Coriobacteriia bacterium]|nr:DNA topoisomerase I [Coriobacteriia bacterium]